MKPIATILTVFFTVMFSSSGHAAGVKVKKPYLGEAPMFQMIQSDAKANIIFLMVVLDGGATLDQRIF